MLYRYSTCADSPQAEHGDTSPVVFDVEKLKAQLHKHFSSSATRALRYSWWYPLLRVCPSSVHTLWLSAKRCSNSRRTRPSVFIIKVPFRSRDAYTCITPQPQLSLHKKPSLSLSLPPLKSQSHAHSHAHAHSSPKPSTLRPTTSSIAQDCSSRNVSPIHPSHPASPSPPPRAHSLSQPHSRIHHLETLHEIDIDVDPDPLNYHECNDPACQANLDAYFLHRIETYTPMLQMMRDRQRRRRGGSNAAVIDDSEPVVVVTNWQHSEHYPSEWIVRFREVVKRSLHPSPIYIETYGTDEQTEDQLMEVIEDVKHSSHLFAMLREKAGEVKSSLDSLGADNDDLPLTSPRSKPLSASFRWHIVRQYWPLLLVAFLLVCLVVFRHFLSPIPLPADGADLFGAEVMDATSDFNTLGSSAGYDEDTDYESMNSDSGYQPLPPEPA